MNVRYEDYNRPRFNLDESLVLTWANNIKEYFEDTFKESVSDDIDIILSPKIKEREYGKLSMEEIFQQLNVIRGRYINSPNLTEYDRHIINGLTGDNCKNYLKEFRNNNDLSNVVKEVIDEVRELLILEKITSKTLGEFCNPKMVYIYFNSFKSLTEDEYLCDVRQTLAHELFHAFHFQKANNTFVLDGYICDIVREALADFFSYSYSYNHSYIYKDRVQQLKSEQSARERFYLWQDMAYSDFPYACARFFVNEQQYNYQDLIANGCINKIVNVFELSKIDMLKAYMEFVPNDWQKIYEKAYTKLGKGGNFKSKGNSPRKGNDFLKKLNSSFTKQVGSTYKYLKFFRDNGITLPPEGDAISNKWEYVLKDIETITVIDVTYPNPTTIYSFWIELLDFPSIEIGSELDVISRGRKTKVKVQNIREVDYFTVLSNSKIVALSSSGPAMELKRIE